MVQIPQYIQQVSIDAPSRDIPNVQQPTDGGIGQALSSLGGQISQVAQAAQARQQKLDAFNTRVNWDAFQERQAKVLSDMESNATGDARGLHDGFMKWRQEEGQKILASITNPELRQQYETIFNVSDNEHWGNLSATTESKVANTYQFDQLTTSGEKAKIAIAQNPASMKAYQTDFIDRVNATTLPADLKKKLIDDAQQQWPKFMAAALKRASLETYHFLMGLGSHQERLDFLTRRVIQAESGWDPSAESQTGASGLMQVQPETGVEIAKKLGDKAYLSMSTEERKAYLKDRRVSIAYGKTYLGMMVDRYHGDVEAALVAYNAGPGNADKWIAAGRDYKALPKPQETQPYVEKVLGNMGAAQFVSGAVADEAATAISGKRIPIQTGTQPGRQPLQMQGVNPQVISTWEQVQGDFGRAVPVVSGYRDKATNARAGGVNHSQHLNGAALDIDVSQMSIPDRKRLIQIASAHGFTGIGIYKNSIHLDMRAGKPVAWGSDHHAGSVPAWAFAVAARHRNSKYGPGTGTQVADASGTGGLSMNDAGPQYADGVPGGGTPRSGFVSPVFEGMSAADYLNMQHDAATGYAKAQTAQLAQDTADGILSRAGATNDKPADRAAAYKMLDGIGDAELQKDVKPLIDSHFTRWDAVQKDRDEKTYQQTRATVTTLADQGKASEALTALRTSNLEKGSEKYNSLVTYISKGKVPIDDPNAQIEVQALKADPQAFAKVDIPTKYGNSLTTDTITKLMADQQGIQKTLAGQGDAAAKQQIETVTKANSLITDNLKAIRIPTDEKATPADIQHANLIRAMVTKELEARQAASKTPLLLSDITDTVDSVMKTYPRFKPVSDGSYIKPWTWGSVDTDVSMPEVLDAFDSAKMDPQLAAAALRKAGKPVNAQTLQQTLDDYLAVKNGQ